MSKQYEQPGETICNVPWQDLLRHMVQPEVLNARAREALAWHVACCPRCGHIYELLSQADLDLREEADQLAGTPWRNQWPTRSDEEAVANFWQRARLGEPRRNRATWHAAILRGSRIAAAMAAVLLLAIGGILFCRHGRPSGPIQSSAQAGKETPPGADVTMGQLIALDSEGMTKFARAMLAGERLASEEGRLQVSIWGRHELVLEPGSRATITRSAEQGCVVTLTQGQLNASVDRVKGEGPFHVITAQAELIVLGTCFTVSSTFVNTRLAVHHGQVRIVTAAGKQQAVSAGQAVDSDGVDLMWVDSPRDAMYAAADLLNDPVSLLRDRPWYRQRFAPLVHLGSYLKEQGIVDVDELTLLAVSADPWLLQYPRPSAAGEVACRYRRAGLERAAQFYGFSVEWLDGGEGAASLGPIKDALEKGDLLLAYPGVPIGAEVVRLTKDNCNSLIASMQGSLYRFLTEAEQIPMPVARISRATGSTCRSRQELLRAAATDMHRLLNKSDDSDNLIGLQAVAAWADAIARSSEPLRFDDSFWLSINALCELGHAGLGRVSVFSAEAAAASRSADYKALRNQLGRLAEATTIANATGTCASKDDVVAAAHGVAAECESISRCMPGS